MFWALQHQYLIYRLRYPQTVSPIIPVHKVSASLRTRVSAQRHTDCVLETGPEPRRSMLQGCGRVSVLLRQDYPINGAPCTGRAALVSSGHRVMLSRGCAGVGSPAASSSLPCLIRVLVSFKT